MAPTTIDTVRLLLERLADPKWTRDVHGLAADVDMSLRYRDEGKRFRWVSYRAKDNVAIITLEWLKPKRGILDPVRDFLLLYANFSEEVQFIECKQKPSSLAFNIVAGHLGNHASHGHLLHVEMVGPDINWLLGVRRRSRERQRHSARSVSRTMKRPADPEHRRTQRDSS